MRVLILAFLTWFPSWIYSQTVLPLKNAKTIAWCGVDYSQVRCIGDEGFNDPQNIVAEYFDKWNEIVLDEPSKYDVSRACKKRKIINHIEVAAERNKGVSADGLVIIERAYRVTDEKMTEMISNYPTINDADVCLVFIAEALSNYDAKGIMYAVFFDPNTKEIIWKKRYRGQISGVGFRNLWANPIAEILNLVAWDFNRITK